MTQPPDDRDPQPGGADPADLPVPDDQSTPAAPGTPPDTTPAPDDQPTVAWTPQEPQQPPPPVPLPGDVPAPTAPASTPIISASPSTDAPPPAPTQGWVQPGTPTAAAPLVGWETQGPSPMAPGQAGFVIAGVGARIVAYLIDGVLVTIVPTLLSLFVTDFAGLFDAAWAAGMAGTTAPTTIPVTTDLILVTLISLGVQFIYFVGFWTSGGRATPGMRGLRMQVVDAMTGQTISLAAASQRWIALGAPLGLLQLVQPLQSIAGLAGIGLLVIVFLTTVTNDRRQGLHDRWAGSLVIRSVTSGDGATAAGCVVLALLLIGFAIIVSVAALVLVAPQIEDILSQIGQSI